MYNNTNNQGSYNQNRANYQQQNQQRQMVKKSGATYSKITKGNFEGYPIINAWRKTKNGLMTVKVAPYHASSKTVESEKNTFTKMIAEIRHPNAASEIVPVLMNMTNKKIVIKKYNLVISPNGSGYTSSGKRVSGYFGANFQRR